MSTAQNEIDRLMDWVRIRAAMVSDADIKQTLFQVSHEFFTDTSYWKQAIQFTTIPTVQNYQLRGFPLGIPIRLAGVWDANSFPVRAAMPLGLVPIPNSTPLTVPTVPEELGAVQLLYPPTSAVNMTALFIMTVSLPTDGNDLPEIPDFVLPAWRTVFQDGVLGYILTEPKKPYSDLVQGKYHLQKWRDGLTRARIAASRGNTHETQAWRYPADFRTYSRKGGVSVGNYGFW